MKRKKACILFVICILMYASVIGKNAVEKRLTIVDADSNKPILGAVVYIRNKRKAIKADSNGHTDLSVLEKGVYTIGVYKLNYQLLNTKITINDNTVSPNTLSIKKIERVLEDVVIIDKKAHFLTPASYSDLDAVYIEKNNTGQDLPYLLRHTPSVFVTSDAGTGIGYTSFRIRGSDISRINTSINGIPLNDSESLITYWVDIPDIAASASAIQIQRGIGTGQHGAGSFGASVNISTNQYAKKSSLVVHNSYGSFSSLKNSIAYHTGLIKGKYFFKGRVSRITSDGYIDRADSNLFSLALSGALIKEKNKYWFNYFSGKEKTYQAWYGVPEAMLQANRTYNIYTYENQVDDYKQDHLHFHSSHIINQHFKVGFALHYTHGEGYYEEYQAKQDLAQYGLSNLAANTTPDVIRRRWLRNDFVGFISQLEYNKGNQTLKLGLSANTYKGNHFGRVIHVEGVGNLKHEYYNEPARKNEINTNLTYELQSYKFFYYVDVQYRFIDYTFDTYVSDPTNIKLNYHFFNPKAGLSFIINEKEFTYFSYSIAHKEPKRADLIAASGATLPEAEKLHDIEVGYKRHFNKGKIDVNMFGMFYDNQLVLTGRVNNNGELLAENVKNSYRIGIEVAGSIKLKKIQNRFSFSLSRNKINEFRYIIYDSTYSPQEIIYRDTNISYSPNIIFSNQFAYHINKKFNVGINSHFVGKQYIDNTSDEQAKINAYFTHDFNAQYRIKISKATLDVGVHVFNIFNVLYENNAWTYKYIDSNNQIIRDNYYFPQAGRHAQIYLRFKL